MSSSTARLDAFTDAAFAFAVSLMVVGIGDGAPNYAGLLDALRTIPSFAIGFAIIAMFWWAHVFWRRYRPIDSWRSVMLTLALVLTVLVYVHPLRAMAASFAAFLGGGVGFDGPLGTMFAIYGVGFAVMATIIAALNWEAARSADLDAAGEHDARGQAIRFAILALTGLVSALIGMLPGVGVFAGFAYATLPLSMLVFSRFWGRAA